VNDIVEYQLPRMAPPEKIGQMPRLDITLINTTGRQQEVVPDHARFRIYRCKQLPYMIIE
jgi:hypothetical protein